MRIARKAEKRPSWLVPVAVAIVVLSGAAAVGYEIYGRTVGRPPEMQTEPTGNWL